MKETKKKKGTGYRLIPAVLAAAAAILISGCASGELDSCETPAHGETIPQVLPESAISEGDLFDVPGTDITDITNTPDTAYNAGEEIPETEAVPEERDKIADIIASMSLEEKIGQMFLAGCPAQGAADAITKYHLGGIVMFAVNFNDKTPADSYSECMAYQDAAEIPLLIAVDEEGGTVTRISRYPNYRSSKFAAPRDLYAAGGIDRIISDTVEKCNLLASCGVNVNLAPVCDISTSPDDFMYYRSLGRDAETTSEYIYKVVEKMNSMKTGCSLKHFPGYGSNGDTHTDIITDTREYSEFQTKDFLPFKAGIDAGAGSVMVSHNIVNCIDPDYPASLSVKMHEILRGELGFEGVIITDDLSMGAITEYTDGANAAVRAVIAGNDMLCCFDYATMYPAVTKAVNDGTISVGRIEESVYRILKWKDSLGLLGD